MKIGGLRAGQGPHVVLLHCSSSAGTQWRQLVERLSDRFAVWAPDLIGYGATDGWPSDVPLSPADEIELVRRSVEDADGPVHLVGHSYGGLIALNAALSGAFTLRSLTLIEPIAFWLLREVGDTALFEDILRLGVDFNAGLDAGTPVAGVRTYFDYWNGPGAWDNASSELQSYVLRTAAKTYKEWPNAFEPTTPLSAFESLATPTMLVRGTATQPPTDRIVSLLAGAVPQPRVVEIEGAGHMAPITHPVEVNDAIESFIVSLRYDR